MDRSFKKLKLIIKTLGGIVFFYLGGFHFIRFINNISGKRLTILTYHRVTDRNIENIETSLPYLFVNQITFEKQLQFLKKYYRIINFKILKEYIKNNKRIPRNSLIITFDDGYEDNYYKAYPILKRMNIPATFLITVEKIGDKKFRPFWWDRAYHYFKELQKKENNLLFLLNNDREIFALYKEFKSNPSSLFKRLNTWETNKIEDLIKLLEEKYNLNNKDGVLRAENRMLNWKQIFEMKETMEFGSHTCNHYNLVYLEENQRRHEIKDSLKLLGKYINNEIYVFSLPSGNVDEDIKKIIRDSGYDFALTTKPGVNNLNDPFELKTINVWEKTASSINRNFSKGIFSYSISGFRLNLLRPFSPNGNKKQSNNIISEGKLDASNHFVKNKERRKINILFIIDNLWYVAGTENHLYYIIKNLNHNKFNCYIVTFDLRKTFFEKIKEENIKVFHIPLKRMYTPKAFFKAFEIRKIIKNYNIDIVQTFHFMSDTYGVLISKLSGVKYVISSRRDTGFNKKRINFFLNKVMNNMVDKFIVVSNAVGDVLSKFENIPKEKIIKIYNGVDIKRFNIPSKEDIKRKREEMGIKQNDFVICMVGHFRPEKGHDIFLNAVKEVKKSIRQIKAVIVGGGLGLEKYKSFCKTNDIYENVLFAGAVKDVDKYISVCDIACVPSITEGFSNALLEEMALGKPIIATAVGGNIEAVVDGENGLLIPPFNHKKLSEGILFLYNNPSIRQKMGEKSRERVELLFSLENMIKNYEKLYDGIVNK